MGWLIGEVSSARPHFVFLSSLDEWGHCIATLLILRKGHVMILCHRILSQSIVCHSHFYRRLHRVRGFVLKPLQRRHRALFVLTQ